MEDVICLEEVELDNGGEVPLIQLWLLSLLKGEIWWQIRHIGEDEGSNLQQRNARDCQQTTRS